MDHARADEEETVMSDSERERGEATASEIESATELPRQPPTLTRKEVAAIEQIEDIENLMEEPPSGELSIISDMDVPGEPG
jgi:hypothetical protein